MNYQHLLEEFDDMVLIATLILPEHTETVVSAIGKTMNIEIDSMQLLSIVKSNDKKGRNKVCFFEYEKRFIYIDCHKPQDLHKIIIRCFNSEKDKIYNSFYEWVELRQKEYGQPIINETKDWMHPDNKYQEIKNPLLSSLQFNELIDSKNDI